MWRIHEVTVIVTLHNRFRRKLKFIVQLLNNDLTRSVLLKNRHHGMMKKSLTEIDYFMDNELDLDTAERNIRMRVCLELARISEKEKKKVPSQLEEAVKEFLSDRTYLNDFAVKTILNHEFDLRLDGS